MSAPDFEALLERSELHVAAMIERRGPVAFVARSATNWRGLKAGDRALPLTDLGRRLLGLHLTTTTPKEN